MATNSINQIQKSELESIARKYSVNEIWEEALGQCLKDGKIKPEDFIRLLSNYVLFGDEFGAGTLIAAGAISKRKDLFNYTPPKPDVLNDMPYLIGQLVHLEAIPEYGDRMQNGGLPVYIVETKNINSPLRTHRQEAIETLLATAEFFGYESQSQEFQRLIKPYQSTLTAIIEVDEAYQIDKTSPSSKVAEFFGVNYVSEATPAREFFSLDNFLMRHGRDIIYHLVHRDMYYWLKEHGGEAGLEAEHSDFAYAAMNFAMNNFTGDRHMFKTDVLKGADKYYRILKEFMKGLLRV